MDKFKNLFAIRIIVVMLSLALVGCGGANKAPANSPAADPGALKVAILLPGPIDDKGWSQSGYEGLKQIEKEIGAQVAYTASVPVDESEQEKITRQYVQDGYDLIMGHGGEYQAVFEKVAEEFPRTQFALITGYGGNNKNLGGLAVRADEAGYLGGVVAALKTKSNKVAYIGGEVYPSTTDEANAFEKAVKDTKPEVEVVITWVESWSDQDKARQIAQELIAAGVDVLAVDADLAAFGVFEVAEKEGVQVIGWASDQHDLAPKAIVTSVLQKMSVRLLQAAVLVKEGRWEGKQYKLGIQEGVIDLAPSYGALTAEEEKHVASVKADIIAGKIQTLP